RLVLRRAAAQVPPASAPPRPPPRARPARPPRGPLRPPPPARAPPLSRAAPRVVAEPHEIHFLRPRIGIASLTFHGATLMVRPDAAAPIPLLEGTWPRRTRPIWGGARQVAASRSAPSAWSWMIERFDPEHGQLRV